ncbi:MAG: hypothetical protein U1E26_05875 [Coriobacteriia bacterium]|nr:hypothetical protein [Coriobacteriia bacterium]
MTVEASAARAAKGTVLVVGADPDWDLAHRLAADAEQIVCFTLEGLVALGHQAGHRVSVVDVTYRMAELEAEGWALATNLIDHLKADAPWLSPEMLAVTKRSVFMWVLWPIVQARARATAVRPSVGEWTDIKSVGVSALDELALAGPLAAVTRDDDVVAAATSHNAGAAERALDHDTQRRGADLRLAAAALAGSAAGGPRCAVLLSQRVHLRALKSAIAALSRTGWQHVLIDMSVEGDVRKEAPDAFETVVHLNPQTSVLGTPHDILDARAADEQTALVIAQWARSSDLSAYAANIASGFAWHHNAVSTWAHAHEILLGAASPAVLLCANETSPVIESVIPPARQLGVPTVNVQHGSIARTVRRAEFGFDAFCVFGAAHAEMLEALGTPASGIRVVGNPFLDGLPPSTPTASGETSATRAVGVRHPLVVLFAAQHSGGRLTSWVIYETLKVILEFLEFDSDCRLVLKLHPLGAGHELGYEMALAEHPDLAVEIVRDAPLYDLIGEADCVATYSSTVAFETPSLRKPTIIVNPLASPDPVPLVVDGTALSASTAGEFAGCIDAIRAGTAVNDETYLRVEERYAHMRDGRAGARVAEVCGALSDGEHEATLHKSGGR